ncbi:hypothetical protein K523DRAFT_254133 [Schizophyllum commune Tattone D]|nr:hypothetical protein K523DRAFT_254133 [Schizophyllum commune Tattone D]
MTTPYKLDTFCLEKPTNMNPLHPSSTSPAQACARSTLSFPCYCFSSLYCSSLSLFIITIVNVHSYTTRCRCTLPVL